MEDKEFEQLVIAGIEALPEKFQKLLQNVAIVIGDSAPNGEELFGLYEGIPVTERGSDYGMVLPDKITIFKDTVLKVYTDPEDIKQCVSNTVWHEIAHHFGFDEEWVEAEEIKRGKLL
jgi:predicted Zn-dependent protease with MMP-like domain